MTDTITPYQIPQWVPGETVGSSDALGWKEVIQRSYRLCAVDVVVPPVDHFAVMLQCAEPVELQRRSGPRWQRERYAKGDVSLLSVAQESHWRWVDTLEVSHVYLSRRLLITVAEELAAREVSEVTLRDVLVTTDPVLTYLATAITAEAALPGLGAGVYVEALATQMAVHLLRRYSTVSFQPHTSHSKLDGPRLRKLRHYVDEHLHDTLSVAQLAEQVGMGSWAFSRAFKQATGSPAHQYIVSARVKRAQALLTDARLPLRDIAAQCGFSDQAHMTRLLKAALGLTPRQLRTHPHVT
ncbi:helix-turn-helix domain-containing protein [Pseudomonas turukhanskensis]|uniref:AraC family transcriptional regulator n=1 Tax=Pseudomonas turukhanskensis TaxID=1806536 RepID=A0A9W6K9B3_9PSED|nr:AraC family transcriptional regulator [Pseudomonas turukhanskensis]GLK91112.1 AraC family transcriptional regulator [Pseudomonas turukhanskensis]